MASKPDQVAVLDPKTELRFKGPFTEVTTARLNIRNPTDRSLCFKVKTTAPKRYCVRPNNGIIPPQKSVEIAVMLQPFDFEAQQQERNKHKFMVQTMYVPEGEFANADTLWRDAKPEDVMDSKLKCVFDTPGGDASAGQRGGSNSGVQSSGFTSLNDNELNHQQENIQPPAYESSATSPPAYSMPTGGNSGGQNGGISDREYERMLEENKTLRDQLSAARKENLSLKEEQLRSRSHTARSSAGSPLDSSSLKSPSAGSTSSYSTAGSSGSDQLQAGGMSPILLALGALVLGLIFGKLLL